MFSEILNLGKKIYNLSNWREKHRYVVFCGRALLHRHGMERLYRFFREDELRRRILEGNPFPMEQVTRAFFYAGSTFEERAKLICTHYELLAKCVQPEWVVKLSTFYHSYRVWDMKEQGVDWHADLNYAPGQRKEGLMSLMMTYEGVLLYQMMFWLGIDKKGETSLYIGAMQGPNVSNAKDLIKDATKRSYRYRTKNLILYMTMAVARGLGMKHIYAVTNKGYYAMNHVRYNRKLKTDFGEFWVEAGGHPTGDEKFYEIPLVEPRKTLEEVPTRKRAVYRKRFVFLDEVDAKIVENMEKIVRTKD